MPIRMITPAPFYSEFLWDYNENLFWEFVNSSRALYSTASSDQGIVYLPVYFLIALSCNNLQRYMS